MTAFCLLLPEMNLSRPLRPAAGLRTRISVPSLIPVCLPGGPEALDDLGEGAERDAGHDGAAACCEQGPHLADGASGRGAVAPEPSGQHVVSGTVAGGE